MSGFFADLCLGVADTRRRAARNRRFVGYLLQQEALPSASRQHLDIN